VRQLEIKVLDIVDARCNHEIRLCHFSSIFCST